MKIFIAGGSGRVATDLIKDLVADGHEIIAGARHPENIIKDDNVTAVKLDLHASAEEIAKVIGRVSAVYFVAGSRGNDLLQTDAFGAVKVMQATKKNQIKRFIMLSSLFALQPDKWNQPGLADLTDYNIAKFFADNYLINDTDLDYTILQASLLTEEPGTGKISFGASKESTNPIADVAETLAGILNHANTIKKVLLMKSGNMPINTALGNVY
ncbi:NAD(P)-binding oxidoreductase [Companilactobacillus sp.]|jgi:nucleoside-diphosphate-sugar epimerase|uniref:NAD(P)-binding oxidoreductase n=1 Tax=Companilactobacillus sp. TaxID=2767905 RepID=UPI0025B86191|nr:NAD(P)-binding oxidoreductase [Companilactobacillus sp.]MCH4009145.1 SDR family oxidoreductase [Companilactobacillus sp.]MCH4050676.1 SDR family oxidoreductase [Companilactobacillus sp.]MCH4077087.1 SDR family oxidoreductase [Companilactobacillus sp.]MCH4125663.1 SDR family oxidoreductase [Companilactobacillus sp.]MCI1311372.1 SDR family oxidoreductase [Companilactobacillus sp.]